MTDSTTKRHSAPAIFMPYLSLSSLGAAASVCTSWLQQANQDLLWRRLVFSDYPQLYFALRRDVRLQNASGRGSAEEQPEKVFRDLYFQLLPLPASLSPLPTQLPWKEVRRRLSLTARVLNIYPTIRLGPVDAQLLRSFTPRKFLDSIHCPVTLKSSAIMLPIFELHDAVLSVSWHVLTPCPRLQIPDTPIRIILKFGAPLPLELCGPTASPYPTVDNCLVYQRVQSRWLHASRGRPCSGCVVHTDPSLLSPAPMTRRAHSQPLFSHPLQPMFKAAHVFLSPPLEHRNGGRAVTPVNHPPDIQPTSGGEKSAEFHSGAFLDASKPDFTRALAGARTQAGAIEFLSPSLQPLPSLSELQFSPFSPSVPRKTRPLKDRKFHSTEDRTNSSELLPDHLILGRRDLKAPQLLLPPVPVPKSHNPA